MSNDSPGYVEAAVLIGMADGSSSGHRKEGDKNLDSPPKSGKAGERWAWQSHASSWHITIVRSKGEPQNRTLVFSQTQTHKRALVSTTVREPPSQLVAASRSRPSKPSVHRTCRVHAPSVWPMLRQRKRARFVSSPSRVKAKNPRTHLISTATAV